MQYTETALVAAHAAGWTAAQAATAPYAQVATASGVTLGPDGESPADFFWRYVRRMVARQLAAEEAGVVLADKRARLLAKAEELADFVGVTVTRVKASETVEGPGWFVTKGE